MHLVVFGISAVAITLLYCIYRRARSTSGRHHRKLRKRVAYMVWAAAQHAS